MTPGVNGRPSLKRSGVEELALLFNGGGRGGLFRQGLLRLRPATQQNNEQQRQEASHAE